MLIGYWFLITSEQIEYDILITKVDQYLKDGVSFLAELLALKGSWSQPQWDSYIDTDALWTP